MSHLFSKEPVMKSVIMLAFLLLASNCYKAEAQSAIYISDNGAWGVGFDDGNNSIRPTAEELRNLAMDQCKHQGGINCRLYYEKDNGGWWAIIRGATEKYAIYFEAVSGAASEQEAIDAVKKRYKGDGGIDGDNIVIKTWYCPRQY